MKNILKFILNRPFNFIIKNWNKISLIQKISILLITIAIIISIYFLFISPKKPDKQYIQWMITENIRLKESLHWEDEIKVNITWQKNKLFISKKDPVKIDINIPKSGSSIITDYNTNKMFINSLLKNIKNLDKSNINITDRSEYTSIDSNHLAYIEKTLKIVSEKWEDTDINRDGKINCIDAAILFYKYYPENNVRIISNRNTNTDFYHLFNAIFINGVWQEIEPQAYGEFSYCMIEFWGDRYDCSLNEDLTSYYSFYAIPVQRNK